MRSRRRKHWRFNKISGSIQKTEQTPTQFRKIPVTFFRSKKIHHVREESQFLYILNKSYGPPTHVQLSLKKEILEIDQDLPKRNLERFCDLDPILWKRIGFCGTHVDGISGF